MTIVFKIPLGYTSPSAATVELSGFQNYKDAFNQRVPSPSTHRVDTEVLGAVCNEDKTCITVTVSASGPSEANIIAWLDGVVMYHGTTELQNKVIAAKDKNEKWWLPLVVKD